MAQPNEGRRSGGIEQTPPQYTARRKPESIALMGDLRMHEMEAFDDRLGDIQKAEDHGYQWHFRVFAELLAGGAIGAWVSGSKFFPAILVLVAAALFYFASMAIDEAHADSIGSFRRDFRRVTEDIELVEDDKSSAEASTASPGSSG